MIYNKIVNPLTGRYVSVSGPIGKKVLKNYIENLYGGATPIPIDNGVTPRFQIGDVVALVKNTDVKKGRILKYVKISSAQKKKDSGREPIWEYKIEFYLWHGIKKTADRYLTAKNLTNSPPNFQQDEYKKQLEYLAEIDKEIAKPEQKIDWNSEFDEALKITAHVFGASNSASQDDGRGGGEYFFGGKGNLHIHKWPANFKVKSSAFEGGEKNIPLQTTFNNIIDTITEALKNLLSDSLNITKDINNSDIDRDLYYTYEHITKHPEEYALWNNNFFSSSQTGNTPIRAEKVIKPVWFYFLYTMINEIYRSNNCPISCKAKIETKESEFEDISLGQKKSNEEHLAILKKQKKELLDNYCQDSMLCDRSNVLTARTAEGDFKSIMDELGLKGTRITEATKDRYCKSIGCNNCESIVEQNDILKLIKMGYSDPKIGEEYCRPYENDKKFINDKILKAKINILEKNIAKEKELAIKEEIKNFKQKIKDYIDNEPQPTVRLINITLNEIQTNLKSRFIGASSKTQGITQLVSKIDEFNTFKQLIFLVDLLINKLYTTGNKSLKIIKKDIEERITN
uniref:Uncharacterized protein n=1 Tax=viral metagenome TaxID=1070528 RepID=A0A6C0IX53_9ZZZZ